MPCFQSLQQQIGSEQGDDPECKEMLGVNRQEEKEKAQIENQSQVRDPNREQHDNPNIERDAPEQCQAFDDNRLCGGAA